MKIVSNCSILSFLLPYESTYFLGWCSTWIFNRNHPYTIEEEWFEFYSFHIKHNIPLNNSTHLLPVRFFVWLLFFLLLLLLLKFFKIPHQVNAFPLIQTCRLTNPDFSICKEKVFLDFYSSIRKNVWLASPAFTLTRGLLENDRVLLHVLSNPVFLTSQCFVSLSWIKNFKRSENE